MKIWVDADACPVVIKNILFKAADRTCIQTILVANQPIQVPRSPFIRTVQVPSGFDVADQEIVKQVCDGDLVITADPLLNERRPQRPTWLARAGASHGRRAGICLDNGLLE